MYWRESLACKVPRLLTWLGRWAKMSVHRKVFVAHIFNFFIPLLSLTHVELNRLKRKTFAWCQVHFPVNSLGFGKQGERAVFAPTPKCMLIVFKVLAWKMETFLLFQTWSVWNPDTFHLGEQRQQVRVFFCQIWLQFWQTGIIISAPTMRWHWSYVGAAFQAEYLGRSVIGL